VRKGEIPNPPFPSRLPRQKKAKTPRYPEGENTYRIRKKEVKEPIQAGIGKSACARSDIGKHT